MLKKILIALVGTIVALIIVGFMLPGKMELTRYVLINAGAESVFNEINNLKKNPEWSYWDSLYRGKMTVTYGEISAGVGATSSWDGPESGKGSMTITESIPNKSIKMDLNFMEDGTANSWYTLEQDGDQTKLSTGFVADMGINPFARWIGMLMIKPEMEKALDHNLSHLKKIGESKPRFTVIITEVELSPSSYIGISSTINIDDMEAMSTQMGKSFGELYGVLQKEKVEMAGAPFCLYPRWDEETRIGEMVCALPVPANTKLPTKYSIVQAEGGKAVKAIHMGDYHKLSETHDQLDKYIAFKKLEVNGAPWEIYVTDPGAEPDTAKWVTEVYYPINK